VGGVLSPGDFLIFDQNNSFLLQVHLVTNFAGIRVSIQGRIKAIDGSRGNLDGEVHKFLKFQLRCGRSPQSNFF
jgi:hypothetical protein